MPDYKKALVRKPPHSMKNGITSQSITPDYAKAILQHTHYINTLKKLNVDVHILEPAENYPDSHFVEDTAILFNNYAILTFPGARERRGEVALLAENIRHLFPIIEIEGNETTLVDGGDVLFIGQHVLIGIYQRTTQAGAEQLKSILLAIDPNLQIHFVPFSGLLHLKSGLTALNDKTLIGNPAITLHTQLPFVDIKWLPVEEGYAANTLTINGSTLHFYESQQAAGIIAAAGNEPVAMNLSEFKKMDGSFTCLSLLW